MPRLFICQACGEEYNPLVTEDDCGLCVRCVGMLDRGIFNTEWSGYPDPDDPDNYWIDDKTGERVNALTGERTIKGA